MITITPLVSIIIPIYNTEKYLTRCLDSVCNQTLHEIEIICVNDGSTDKSAEILHQYASLDGRIRVINQKNQGIASARNTGLHNASGEYIGFVDSDDWVEADLFETAYKMACSTKQDIIAWGHVLELGNESIPVSNPQLAGKHGLEKALSIALSEDMYRGFLWNKLFSRQLIIDKMLKFHDAFNVLEDLVFVCESLLCTDGLIYLSDTKYHYQRENGTTYTLNEKSVSMEKATRYLVELLEKENYPIALRYAKAWYNYSAGALFLYYSANNDHENANYYKKQRLMYWKEYMLVYKKNAKRLCRGFLIMLFPKISVWMKKKQMSANQ